MHKYEPVPENRLMSMLLVSLWWPEPLTIRCDASSSLVWDLCCVLFKNRSLLQTSLP